MFRPSMAPRTVIAGVIMPSPYSSAAPKMPSGMRIDRLSPAVRSTNAVSARMPPSPSLSARNTTATYFSETTISSE